LFLAEKFRGVRRMVKADRSYVVAGSTTGVESFSVMDQLDLPIIKRRSAALLFVR